MSTFFSQKNAMGVENRGMRWKNGVLEMIPLK
jgi:hypothetical protein